MCIVQAQMVVTLLYNIAYGATAVHTCAVDERHSVIGTCLCAAEIASCHSSDPYPPRPFSLLSLSSFLKRQDFPIRHPDTNGSPVVSRANYFANYFERLSFFVVKPLPPCEL